MRNIKRITCLVLCMAIVFSGIYTASAENAFVPDKKGQALVETLGFFSDFSDSYVTRREYAKALLAVGGYVDAGKKVSDDALSDMAREAKLIGMFDDGKAGLEMLITYGEVLAGIVCTLGYDITVVGGKPSLDDMIVKANLLGIGKGIDKASEARVTGKEFGEMLFRMLTTDAVEITGYSNEGVTADITKGRTLLEIHHNVYNYTGTVTANCRSSLYDASGVGEGRVRLDDNFILKTGNTDAEFYLGYGVECYYRSKDGENTLILIEKSERCKELYLESFEIDEYSDNVYWYTQNSNSKKAQLSGNVSVIYNSVATSFSKLTLQQIVPAVGEITLIDHDGSAGYDTVIIMDYESAISGGATECGIVDSKGNVLLDTEKTDDYDIYDVKYKEMQITSVLPGGIIWVAKSLENTYASVIISADSASGKISKMWNRGTYTAVELDGREYRISPKCVDKNKLSVGMSVNVYLDPAGSIAGFRAAGRTDMKFGYLYAAAETGFFGDQLSMAIFDGEHRRVECADTVIVNGKGEKTSEKILAPLKDGETIVAQLVRFRMNDDGKLCEYETALPENTNEEPDEADRLFIEGHTPNRNEGTSVYYQPVYHYTVGNKFAFEATSSIFVIPDDLTLYNDFGLTTPQYIAGDNIYGLIAYKTDSNYDYATAGVWRDSGAALDKTIVTSDSPYVVLEIAKSLKDDEDVFTVKVALGTSIQEIPVTDEDLVEMFESGKIKEGDIINFDLAPNGDMATLVKRYNYADNPDTAIDESHEVEANTETGFTAKNRVISAEVTKKMNSSIKVKMAHNNETEHIIFGAYGSTRVAVVDIGRGGISVKSGSIVDVEKGDKFVYMSRNAIILYMYIIKD